MKLSLSEMETIRYQFDSRCRKILREESRTIKRAIAKKAEKEMTFSQLSDDLLNRLSTVDVYPSDFVFFEVSEYRIAVENDLLAKVLLTLPRKKRDVLLLAFFLDMKDTEIAAKLKVAGSTIHRRKRRSLEELKSQMEVLKHERNTK